VLEFYNRVADQVTDQALPRLEGYEASLRLYGYPPERWRGLLAGALTLHRLMTNQDTVYWFDETGKSFGEICPEDVADGDEG